jgi:hypothetical protein
MFLPLGSNTDRNLKHGIEFGYVGGDPAELMRICVENGAFTVAFLKEGLLKVCDHIPCLIIILTSS